MLESVYEMEVRGAVQSVGNGDSGRRVVDTLLDMVRSDVPVQVLHRDLYRDDIQHPIKLMYCQRYDRWAKELSRTPFNRCIFRGFSTPFSRNKPRPNCCVISFPVTSNQRPGTANWTN